MAVDDQKGRLFGVRARSQPSCGIRQTYDRLGAERDHPSSRLHPELVERLTGTNGGELTHQDGRAEHVSLSAEHSVARMPVEGHRQVVGILHGGAHVVLGESLGSISSGDPCRAGPRGYGNLRSMPPTVGRSPRAG